MSDETGPLLKTILDFGIRRNGNRSVKRAGIDSGIHPLLNAFRGHEHRPMRYPVKQSRLQIGSKCGELNRIGGALSKQTWFNFVWVREIALQRIATWNDTKLRQRHCLQY